MSASKWLFFDPPNTMAITLKRIFENKNPILYVSHDKEDGMWQFLDGDKVDITDSTIVSIQEIINYDPSIAEISDLPLGWFAVRQGRYEEWIRSIKNVEPLQRGYYCTICGEYHDELPLSYGSNAPYYWYQVNPDEREDRCEINSDLCVIDEADYFIRGCIEIPVVDESDKFSWDVWVSISKENFERTMRFWNEVDRDVILEPMFGWLSTELPCYANSTLNLKTRIHSRKVGIRPFIELEPTDHPLAIEQREGISIKRVQQISDFI